MTGGFLGVFWGWGGGSFMFFGMWVGDLFGMFIGVCLFRGLNMTVIFSI